MTSECGRGWAILDQRTVAEAGAGSRSKMAGPNGLSVIQRPIMWLMAFSLPSGLCEAREIPDDVTLPAQNRQGESVGSRQNMVEEMAPGNSL
jgi:hypothetical protein